MSVTGIASTVLSALNASHSRQSEFQQARSEFQQLSQDLQSGNLTQAQQDYATISKNFPVLTQTSGATSGTAATATSGAAGTTGTSQTATNPLVQEFTQLGQDLQAGNLQAAQQDFTNIQQTAQQNVQNAQQNAQQAGGHHHHHHHHVENTQNASPSSSLQATNPINQAFSTLSQDLQSGNLQGAQQAFATLQNDLQQIGGFTAAGSTGAASAAIPASTGSLNVSA
jgi:outer membrane protein assembly factor BamD (BamD/ComL family)